MSDGVRLLSPEFAELPRSEQVAVRSAAARFDPMTVGDPPRDAKYACDAAGMAHAMALAAEANFTIIRGDSHTLTIDLDGGAVLDEQLLKLLAEMLGEVPVATTWKSKSGGTHWAISFRHEFAEAEAIALEAALGSDRKRALLCVVRLKNDVSRPRVLFKPPAAHLTDLTEAMI